MSANAPNQNTLAIDSSSFSIIAGLFDALYAGPGYGGASPNIGNNSGFAIWAIGWMIGGVFLVVVLIPFLGCFMCPSAVAGLGLRCFVTSSLFMFGHPLVGLRAIEIDLASSDV